MKPLAALSKGDEDKHGQRWGCVPSFLKVQNLEHLQSCAKLQQLQQPWGPPDLYHISKVWHTVARLTLPFTHPLHWKRVGKASAIQRLAHAGFRVLVWENFIWNLGECRLINVLVCRVRENLAERPCFPHTQWRSKAVLLQQSIPADIRERLNSSSRMKKKFKFKSAFLFPLQRWRKPLFSKFCIFLSSTDHSAGSARHQRRSLSDFLVRR